MTATVTQTETKQKFKPINMWRVILHNDDYTPMEFVMQVLMQLYGKTLEDAEAITMNVHNTGKGVAGVYTREIAEQKVSETLRVAQHYSHPLLVTAEEA